MLRVVFPFILFFSSIAFAGEKYGNFPELVPSLITETSGPFLDDKKFSGSCGGEGQQLPNDIANMLIHSGRGNNYFFFSLTEYLADSKIQKHEYRFFKDKSLKGSPSFILNENGFFEGGKLVCAWRLKYSEDNLYANNLVNCFSKDEFSGTKSPLSYQILSGGQEAIYLCSIMNVSKYFVEEGRYSYQVEINGNFYFLDVSNFPKLQNGENFYSAEKIVLQDYKNNIERAYKVSQAFINFKDTPKFQSVLHCIVNKDTNCLDEYWTQEFFEQVAVAGYKHICNNGHTTSSKGPMCGDYKDYKSEILKSIYRYMTDIFNEIANMKTENFTLEGDQMRYRVSKPHTDMGEASIFFDIKNGNFKLTFFDDDIGC